MQEEYYDEDFDIYKESTSRILYKKTPSGFREKSRHADGQDKQLTFKGKGTDKDVPEWYTDHMDIVSKSKSSDVLRPRGRTKDTVTFAASDEHLRKPRKPYDRDYYDKDQDDSRDRPSRRRPSAKDRYVRGKPTGKDKLRKSLTVDPDLRGSKEKDGGPYYAVTKWEVDYTNKNYLRSKINKPTGLHRHIFGRAFNWTIDYDNTYYLSSKVNAPKGLHRRKRELDVKRKRVPDNDILADSTGWEFETGLEFFQIEGDMPFHPRERIRGRGGYRFYGVQRNNSDMDRKMEEKHYDPKDITKDEMIYGAEFLQDDVAHNIDPKGRKIGRGAYRFYDTQRSCCDDHPRDVLGVDYRKSRADVDIDVPEDKEEVVRKGKPFKRTVLKKTFKLTKPPSPLDQLAKKPVLDRRSKEAQKISKPLPVAKSLSKRHHFKTSKKLYFDDDGNIRGIESHSKPVERRKESKKLYFDEDGNIRGIESHSKPVERRKESKKLYFDEDGNICGIDSDADQKDRRKGGRRRSQLINEDGRLPGEPSYESIRRDSKGRISDPDEMRINKDEDTRLIAMSSFEELDRDKTGRIYDEEGNAYDRILPKEIIMLSRENIPRGAVIDKRVSSHERSRARGMHSFEEEKYYSKVVY